MNPKLRVVFAAAEAAPFARSSAVADVAGALLDAIATLGIETALVLPRYRRPEIEALELDVACPELAVPLGTEKVRASVHRAERGGHSVYFIDNPKYFYRDEIYGSRQGEYLDNDERFAFFSRAVCEFLLKARLSADIIHCHDWPTALIPLFLRTHYAQKTHFKDTATVFSLHDARSQGSFPPESLAMTGLSWDYFTSNQLSLNGRFNYLKAGLISSDVLDAATESGSDVADILGARREVVFSVRNGGNERTWAEVAADYIELYRIALGIKRGGQRV
jgi:starch synthase